MSISAVSRAEAASLPIKRANPADAARLAPVFAAAFDRDPVFDWLTRDGNLRAPALQRFFDWILAQAIPHGETWTDADGLAAAAWLPPTKGATRQSFFEGLRTLPAVLRLTGVSRLMRGAAMAAAMEDAHPKEPCFYLAFIGVDPCAQGSGLGTQVLAHTLKRVDEAGAGAYLENSNPRNMSLYQRAGFSVTRKIVAKESAPPIYAMWRPAQRRKA